jgi:uncharacterized protein (TIGR00730 family)
MKTVCVFCGSNPGRNPAFKEGAIALGQEIVSRGLGLVYGGGNVGLMGVVADAVLAEGGEVIGVIPGFLVNRELAHPGLSKLHVVDSMHQRKALMAELSDGFIAMPGGYGTFEEFCEILTWSQLGLHQKPHGLLNIMGYYEPLIRLFDTALHEQFLSSAHRAMVLEAPTPAALLNIMSHYVPPTVTKEWVDRTAKPDTEQL